MIEETIHQDDCLLCAVRALTEGTPPTWSPKEEGETVHGVLVATGSVPLFPGIFPYWDLWTGGKNRIRLVGQHHLLKQAIEYERPQVGDTVHVSYNGRKQHPNGGRFYRTYSANAERGH